jgi:hypothetical protein
MIKRAYQDGVRDASERFGVREAMTLMDLIAGIGTPMVAKAGLNTLAPKLMPRVEKALEVPFQGLKSGLGGAGRGISRFFRGPGSPAEALSHGLSGTPAPAGIRDPSALIEHMKGRLP